jgi:electron transport complex protein RnfA
MNLILQCALGIKGISEAKKYGNISAFIILGIIFISIILLWLVFSRLFYSMIPGMFIYILLFPVSYIVYEGFEYFIFCYLMKRDPEDERFISFPGGITAAAVFVCVNIANNILETIVLSFGFSLGIYLVYLITREIRKRAYLEKVPSSLRGKPLVLIAMGLLSLVFSVSSLLLLGMIGTR